MHKIVTLLFVTSLLFASLFHFSNQATGVGSKRDLLHKLSSLRKQQQYNIPIKKTSSGVDAGVFTNVFQLVAIRNGNNITDTDNNNKLITLFYDGINKRMRYDQISIGGADAQLQSTSVVYDILRYYMNIVSIGFCIFEHVHPNSTAFGPRIFPFNSKGSVQQGGFIMSNYKDAQLIQTNQIIDQSNLVNGLSKRLVNLYKINSQSDLAIGFIFYLFNFAGPQFYDLYYYEDAVTKVPARLMVKGIGGGNVDGVLEVIDTTFYSDKDDSSNVFEKDLFYWNVKDSCH
ncbi:hypothetical protein ABK040_011056 [Willaertia magna]